MSDYNWAHQRSTSEADLFEKNIFFPYLGAAWVCVWSPVFQQSEVLSNAAVGPAEPRL